MFTKFNSFVRRAFFMTSFIFFITLTSCTNDNSDSEGELEFILPDEETGKNLDLDKTLKN